MAIVHQKLARRLNKMFDARHIKRRAVDLRNFEVKGQRYRFGNWAQELGRDFSTADWGGAQPKANWGNYVKALPKRYRDALTDAIRGNLLSDRPLPIEFVVGTAASQHVMIGRVFGARGADRLVVHLMCRASGRR